MPTVRWKDKTKQDPIVSTDKFALTDIANNDKYCTPEEITAYVRANEAYEWTNQVLTDQATLAWDRELGHNAYLESTQSSTLNGITNAAAGVYHLTVKKAGASADLVFDPNFLFEAGTKPDLAGSTLNSYTKYTIYYDGTSKYICTGVADIR